MDGSDSMDSPVAKARKKRKTKTSVGTGGAANSPKPKDPVEYNDERPSKPRVPHSRTTMSEMRRRVAAILEFIGRTQMDMASDQNKIGDQVVLSSTSADMMDGLTRKLLLWEQEYGRYGERR
ncbi:putative histone deacetylase complex subunit cti6 [Yarrowia sp. B02]|nr:putative histone deacetylase complex subunit cti6 [Yarrowia sp. B02]